MFSHMKDGEDLPGDANLVGGSFVDSLVLEDFLHLVIGDDLPSSMVGVATEGANAGLGDVIDGLGDDLGE